MVPRPERNSEEKQLNQGQTTKIPPSLPFFVRSEKDVKDMDSKSLIAGIIIGFVIGLVLGILLEATLFIV